MSGNAAAGNIEGFVYVTINAFSQASVNFIGQNHGAHQYDRVRKTLMICLGSVTVFGIIASALAYSFAPTLLSFYITDSPQAIAYGILRMSYVCIPYFICGLMDSTTGALRGMGASITPMFITILGACGFRIFWIYTVFQIPEYHTPNGLFISYPISWLITFLIELVVFVFIYRKHSKQYKPALSE
jgi:Na+-driven multidrug efflux pump